jgi:hypothetical protein
MSLRSVFGSGIVSQEMQHRLPLKHFLSSRGLAANASTSKLYLRSCTWLRERGRPVERHWHSDRPLGSWKMR